MENSDKMKVLLVNGSPHREGTTYAALCEVAKTLEEEGIDNEIFWLGNKPIGGCMACGACTKLGKCVYDDVVNVFREKAYEADGFVFGTSVHYGAPTGNMTSFMDRLFYSELCGDKNRALRMKPAACVVAARRAGNTSAYDQMNKYFGIQEMPIVSSRYWNMVHGSNADDVAEDKEGLFTMRTLARNMAYMIKAFKMAKESGLEPPKRERAVFTNFVRKL